MTIQSELLALKRRGLISPARVVEWARANPDSQLHSRFEWDDAKAADAHRVWQARQLLANVTFESKSERLVSLTIDRNRDGGYRDLDEVLANRDLRQVALSDALAELDRFQEKYSELQELAEVFAAADGVKRRVRSRAKIEEARVAA